MTMSRLAVKTKHVWKEYRIRHTLEGLRGSFKAVLNPPVNRLAGTHSVGDDGFQQKSMTKMKELLRSGAKILLVSHNDRAIHDICKRTVGPKRGTVPMDGPSADVEEHYRKFLSEPVRAVAGEIFDMAVVLRRISAIFGHRLGEILSKENKLQILVPKGFAHGGNRLCECAEVLYKASDYYSPESERMVLWNDPDLGIVWPLISGWPPILSGKDASGKRFSEAELFA